MTPEEIEIDIKIKEIHELSSLLKQAVDVSALGKNLVNIDIVLAALQKRLRETNSEVSDLSQTFKDIVNDLSTTNQASKDINKSFRTLGGIADKLKFDAEGISNLNRRDLVSLKEQLKIKTAELASQKEYLSKDQTPEEISLIKNSVQSEEELARLSTGTSTTVPSRSVADQKALYQKIVQIRELNSLFTENNQLSADGNNYLRKAEEILNKRLIAEHKIQNTLGLTGKILDTITKPLSKLGIDTKYFDDLKDSLEDIARTTESKWAVVGKTITGAFDGIKSSLKDPLIQLSLLALLTKQLVKAGLSYSKEIADIGKQYGLTAEAAKGVADYNKDLAFSTKNVLVNQESVAEASQQINEQLGTSVSLGKDLIEGQVNLTKVLGLSGEEAAQLSQYALLYGTTQDKLLQSISKENKGILSNKKVLQEVLKTTGQLAAFYKNSPDLLAKAVVEANKLGLSLQKTKDITDGLLDFESSISSEMEAEVLIGKDLNLNAARALALQGDTVGAAKEMLANLGGINEFYNLNRIQQQAIAQALGMSADDLADTLLKNEKLNALSLEQKKVIEDMRRAGQNDLADQIEKGVLQGKAFDTTQQQVAAQDLFNASVNKLKESFVALVSGPLGAMVDGLAEASKWVSNIFNFLGKIPGAGTLGSIVKVIFGTAGVIAAGFLAVKTLPTMLKNLFLNRPSGRDPDPIHTIVKNLPGGPGGSGTLGNALNKRGQPVSFQAQQRYAQRYGGVAAQNRFGGTPAPPVSKFGNFAGKASPYALGAGILTSLGADAARKAGKEKLANTLDVGGGVLSGAGAGAMIGSIVGPIGTGVGAIVGGLIGLFSSLSNKKKEKEEKRSQSMFEGLPTFAPQDQEVPSIATGGVVQSTGIAKVDQGEVYLGKDTKSTFEKMVRLLEKQTTLLSSTVLYTPKGITQTASIPKVDQGQAQSSKDITYLSNGTKSTFEKTFKLLEKQTTLLSNTVPYTPSGVAQTASIPKVDQSQARSSKDITYLSNGTESTFEKTFRFLEKQTTFKDTQEQAIAQSLGMSVDNLADTLLKQKTKNILLKQENSPGGAIQNIGTPKVDQGEISLGKSSNYPGRDTKSTFEKTFKLLEKQSVLFSNMQPITQTLTGGLIGGLTESVLPKDNKTSESIVTAPPPSIYPSETIDKSASTNTVEKISREVLLDKNTRETFIEMMRALKEHTSLLSIISKKELSINTDKLAYATAKSTAMSYGNPLNSNSYIR